MAYQTKSKRKYFTREEILSALTLEPCHITGEHDPTHTPHFICNFQRENALERLLQVLGTKVDDLPRRVHRDHWTFGPCQFCHGTHEEEITSWAAGAPLTPRS